MHRNATSGPASHSTGPAEEIPGRQANLDFLEPPDRLRRSTTLLAGAQPTSAILAEDKQGSGSLAAQGLIKRRNMWLGGPTIRRARTA